MAIGIDFGLINCVAAFKFAQVEIVTDEGGKSLIRSVVGLDNGEIIVGDKAYYQMKQDPENVIVNIKNLLGRNFSDPVIQKQLQYLNYKIEPLNQGTEDGLVVILGGKEYDPEDLAAEILKKVVKNSELYQEAQGQKEKITKAVITIPAYFNDKQRYAIQNSAKRAELRVKELLPEPIAAAISYGFKPSSDDHQTILVYDLGGGTFDASVISTARDWFSELGKAGDLWLGGDGIDNKLIELIKQKVAQEEDLDDVDDLITKMPSIKQKRLINSFKLAAEQAKIDLSNRTETRVNIAEPLRDEFGSLIFIMSFITRSEFEQLILPLVERTIKICQQAIEDAGITQDNIDVILMVGGSSLIPFVQQNLKQVFGYDKVVVHPRPIYAIAEGAAIVAAGLVEKSLTVSRDYCIKFRDNPRFILIKKGENLPVKKEIVMKTEADGQRLIHLKFFSPDEVGNQLDHTSVDEPIGQMWLALDKHYPKGTEITLIAEIDEENESLQITAHLSSDKSVRVSCSFGRGGQDLAIAKEVEELINQLNQEGQLSPQEVKQVYELAGEIIQASNSMIGDNGRVLEDRKRLAYEKLKELRTYTSEDHDLAYYFLSRFEFAIKHCQSVISQEQQVRIKNIVAYLKDVIDKDNLSGLQKFVEDAKHENENLPDMVNLILICRTGINYASQVNSTETNAMTDKFSQILYALEDNDADKVNSLLQHLLPKAKEYSAQNSDENQKSLVITSVSLQNFSIQNRSNNIMSNNPYDILGVSPAASKDEIEKAFKARMKEKKRHPKVLTAARNKLVKNNEDRLVADYLLPALPPILRFKRYDLSELDKPTPKLELIEEIENENLDEFHAKVMVDFNKNISNLL
jgi:molecular chaperone DnaK